MLTYSKLPPQGRPKKFPQNLTEFTSLNPFLGHFFFSWIFQYILGHIFLGPSLGRKGGVFFFLVSLCFSFTQYHVLSHIFFGSSLEGEVCFFFASLHFFFNSISRPGPHFFWAVFFSYELMLFFLFNITSSVTFFGPSLERSVILKNFLKNAASAANFKFRGVYVVAHIFLGPLMMGNLLY